MARSVRHIRFKCSKCDKEVATCEDSQLDMMHLCAQCFTKRMIERDWPIAQNGKNMTTVEMPPEEHMTAVINHGLNGETNLVIKDEQTGGQLILQMYQPQLELIQKAICINIE